MTTGPRPVAYSFTYATALDNHDPTRDYAHGTADVYAADEDGTRSETIVLRDASDLKDPTRAIYLLDDGATVRPFYVAGWRQDDSSVILQAFPVNPDGRLRPDNGRPVDFSTWQLGPCRAYHLKVTRQEATS